MGNPFERQWNPKSTRAMLTSVLMAAAALSIAIACGGGTPTAPSSGPWQRLPLAANTFRVLLKTRF